MPSPKLFTKTSVLKINKYLQKRSNNPNKNDEECKFMQYEALYVSERT